MAKKSATSTWGKPGGMARQAVPSITDFDRVTTEFGLNPEEYVRSTRLREWVQRNKNKKYVPERLLAAWGFEIETTL
jgi:hypothetical protein